MQVLSADQAVSPVTLPPRARQDLRGLFSTCRLYKKQNTQLKNRVHSLLKEQPVRVYAGRNLWEREPGADIIEVNRFKDSKHFTSYLCSAPRTANSNMSTSIRGTNKKGRKLSSTLLTQSLNHVLDSSGKLKRWYNRLSERTCSITLLVIC
jgi:transposase